MTWSNVMEVFGHWRDTLKKRNVSLDRARRAVIEQRFADGFTVQDLKKAIDGRVRSTFHQKSGNYQFDRLEWILQSRSRVANFMKVADGEAYDAQGVRDG